MLPRSLFSEEHDAFRDSFRRFLDERAVPKHASWEAQGHVDREIWREAGEAGALLTALPESVGGSGGDRLHSAIVLEEVAHSMSSGLGFSVHSDIVATYIHKYGSAAQKAAWLPKMGSGEWVGAIAMTEPGTGSDLQRIATTAVKEGDEYVINGSKTFITNGYHCDLAIVCARIDDGSKTEGNNITLFVVESAAPGFSKGRTLDKLGMKAQDTGELFFSDLRVPADHILGSPGMGFPILMAELAWERLMIAVACVAGARRAFEETVKYTRGREAFGKPLNRFQNTRFKLAEMKTEIQLGQCLVDRCLGLDLEGKLPIDAAASAKYWTSEMLGRVVDECVQLHGGYGYMMEYPIARCYADARVQRIYGGTSEIMKEIVARSL
ncbi:MAG: acyl-CoA dehydrogenase family protein [Pseudomonadota bacterium]